MLDFIETLSNSVEDEAEAEGLHTLHAYFTNNKDGLVGYHRRRLKLPEPPEGKVYRRLGAMESNVFTIIGNRMKGGRACWSIDGGNNLARLLTLKHTKKLHETLDSLTDCGYCLQNMLRKSPLRCPRNKLLCGKAKGMMAVVRGYFLPQPSSRVCVQ